MIVSPWRHNDNMLEADICFDDRCSPILLLRVIPEQMSKRYAVIIRDAGNKTLLASSDPCGLAKYPTAKLAKKAAIKMGLTFIQSCLTLTKQIKD